jgi:putative tryptophan/tyrosine transport system substrate-binding protein
MRRRSFLGFAGAAAAAWPVAGLAQQKGTPVIGALVQAADAETGRIAALHKGLSEVGLLPGRDFIIETRAGTEDQFPAMAAELVARKVNVIYAGGTAPARWAKAATTTTPIVFVMGGDAVRLGYAESDNRPGGNVTGLVLVSRELSPKLLELLHEVAPKAEQLGALLNPDFPGIDAERQALTEAAAKIRQRILILNARSEPEFEHVFAEFSRNQVGAVLIVSDGYFNLRARLLTALTIRHRLPTISFYRLHVEAGGLMSYGANLADAIRHAGVYCGRILKGEKPADLPILRPTKFDLVVNLKTAKAIGLAIPEAFLLRADEVLE